MKPSSLLLVAIVFAAFPLSSQGAVLDGLLSYWNFEGNYNDSAGTLPGNLSTTADNGTAGTAVVLTGAGPLGNYGDFGRNSLGVNNVVQVPNSPDILGVGKSLSISAWFRVDGFDQSWQGLIGHGEATDYRIARRDGENTLGYAGGTGDIPGAGIGPNINDGAWHNVIAISEAGVSTRLWIDGNLIGTGGAPTLTDNGSANLYIGGNPQGDTGSATVTQYRPWNGGIDDVGMWGRAITPGEIGQIVAAGQAGIPLGQIPEPTAGLFVGFTGMLLALRRKRR